MSVTFSVEALQTDPYVVLCGDDQQRDEAAYLSWEDAKAAAETHSCTGPLCEEWGGARASAMQIGPEINMANANAARVLHSLGYTHSDDVNGGVCDGADFLGRVMLAQALTPADAGVPATAHPDQPNLIDCGRRPGYLDDRLEQLRTLAEWAVLQGRRVTWG